MNPYANSFPPPPEQDRHSAEDLARWKAAGIPPPPLRHEWMAQAEKRNIEALQAVIEASIERAAVERELGIADGPKWLAYELKREAKNRAARRWLDDQERARNRPAPPRPVVLTQFLAQPPERPSYRIEGLARSGSLTLVSAPQKAGKTTLIGNLLRSLVDGDPFLGHFPVRPAGAVALIDTESTEDLLYEWLRAQDIRKTDAVKLIPLRGREAFWDIDDPQNRAWWLAELTGAETVLFDVAGPVVAAMGLSEDANPDVARFVVGLRALVAEASAGLAETFLVHHTGHNEERATGASMWLRTPDQIWQLHRETPDPTSPRYFSAYGRIDDVPRGLVQLDPASRRLTYTGESPAKAKAERGIAELLAWLCAEGEPRNATACASYLQNNHGMTRDPSRRVAPAGVAKGLIKMELSGVTELYSPLDLSLPL